MLMLNDTIWDTIVAPPLERIDSFGLLKFKLDMKWEPGVKYKFVVDSAAMIGVYNEWNNTFYHEFTTRKLEDYSALYFNVTGVSDSAVVEVLDKGDK